MPKHFYIFRHGQCPLNITNHIQGQRFNGNLTPIGKLQALKTGEKLKNKNITLLNIFFVIVTSSNNYSYYEIKTN